MRKFPGPKTVAPFVLDLVGVLQFHGSTCTCPDEFTGQGVIDVGTVW